MPNHTSFPEEIFNLRKAKFFSLNHFQSSSKEDHLRFEAATIILLPIRKRSTYTVPSLVLSQLFLEQSYIWYPLVQNGNYISGIYNVDQGLVNLFDIHFSDITSVCYSLPNQISGSLAFKFLLLNSISWNLESFLFRDRKSNSMHTALLPQ